MNKWRRLDAHLAEDLLEGQRVARGVLRERREARLLPRARAKQTVLVLWQVCIEALRRRNSGEG